MIPPNFFTSSLKFKFLFIHSYFKKILCVKNLTYFFSFRNLLFLTLVKFALVTKKTCGVAFFGNYFFGFAAVWKMLPWFPVILWLMFSPLIICHFGALNFHPTKNCFWFLDSDLWVFGFLNSYFSSFLISPRSLSCVSIECSSNWLPVESRECQFLNIIEMALGSCRTWKFFLTHGQMRDII